MDIMNKVIYLFVVFCIGLSACQKDSNLLGGVIQGELFQSEKDAVTTLNQGGGTVSNIGMDFVQTGGWSSFLRITFDHLTQDSSQYGVVFSITYEGGGLINSYSLISVGANVVEIGVPVGIHGKVKCSFFVGGIKYTTSVDVISVPSTEVLKMTANLPTSMTFVSLTGNYNACDVGGRVVRFSWDIPTNNEIFKDDQLAFLLLYDQNGLGFNQPDHDMFFADVNTGGIQISLFNSLPFNGCPMTYPNFKVLVILAKNLNQFSVSSHRGYIWGNSGFPFVGIMGYPNYTPMHIYKVGSNGVLF